MLLEGFFDGGDHGRVIGNLPGLEAGDDFSLKNNRKKRKTEDEKKVLLYYTSLDLKFHTKRPG